MIILKNNENLQYITTCVFSACCELVSNRDRSGEDMSVALYRLGRLRLKLLTNILNTEKADDPKQIMVVGKKRKHTNDDNK